MDPLQVAAGADTGPWSVAHSQPSAEGQAAFLGYSPPRLQCQPSCPWGQCLQRWRRDCRRQPPWSEAKGSVAGVGRGHRWRWVGYHDGMRHLLALGDPFLTHPTSQPTPRRGLPWARHSLSEAEGGSSPCSFNQEAGMGIPTNASCVGRCT